VYNLNAGCVDHKESDWDFDSSMILCNPTILGHMVYASTTFLKDDFNQVEVLLEIRNAMK
jgi:hypothetical protein